MNQLTDQQLLREYAERGRRPRLPNRCGWPQWCGIEYHPVVEQEVAGALRRDDPFSEENNSDAL
jgi:hypothetical protein